MASSSKLTRREMLQLCGTGLLSSALVGCRQKTAGTFVNPLGTPYEGTNEQLLDEIQRAAFDFFWKEASPNTGQVKDRALSNGNDSRRMSSIAATGFGLAALCIGDRREYRRPADIADRVRRTLRFLAKDLPHEHGFFYHFIHMETGQRWGKCELSSIDSTILLCGVLTARQYFADQEIKDLATAIYERVDWPWMQNSGRTLSMGWLPQSGSLDARWEHYCELWGIAVSDAIKGYVAWGGPRPQGPIRGSVVPCVCGGSLPFLFEDGMRVLRNIRGRYRERAWARYALVDAFNPLPGWYNPAV